MWKEERKERVRELRAQAGQFRGEEEFEAWWEEREKEAQRAREIWKARQRELREIKKIA